MSRTIPSATIRPWPQLRPGEPVGTGLRRAAREDIAAVLSRFDDAKSDPGENIHELRTCCKRLRALLKLVPADTRAEQRRFRDAARAVAPLRDREVSARHAESLAGSGAAKRLAAIRIAAADEHQVRRALDLLSTGQDGIADWPDVGSAASSLWPGFERTLAKCRKAHRRAEVDPSDARLHRLRRWVKYHYYQLYLLEPLGPPELAVRAEAMQTLGHLLGEAHDLYVLQSRLPSDSEADRRTLRNLRARKRRRQEKALALASDWLAERPCPLPGDGSVTGDRGA